MYVIIQESRENKGMFLALIDRSKSKKKWWTSIIDNAFVFSSKRAADKACSKYKYNNTRVVTLDIAKELIVPIITVKTEWVQRRKNIFEMDMWEYKRWLGYSDAIECGGESGSL